MDKIIAFSKKFRHYLRGVPKVPLIILLILFAAAISANYLALHNPEIGNPRERLLPPFWQEKGTMKYPLGTDTMGRDVYTRLLFGARTTMIVALTTLVAGGGIGLVVGVISGYFGGKVDGILSRLVDSTLAFPTIFFALMFSVTLGSGLNTLVIAISTVLWARIARGARP